MLYLLILGVECLLIIIHNQINKINSIFLGIECMNKIIVLV